MTVKLNFMPIQATGSDTALSTTSTSPRELSDARISTIALNNLEKSTFVVEGVSLKTMTRSIRSDNLPALVADVAAVAAGSSPLARSKRSDDLATLAANSSPLPRSPGSLDLTALVKE